MLQNRTLTPIRVFQRQLTGIPTTILRQQILLPPLAHNHRTPLLLQTPTPTRPTPHPIIRALRVGRHTMAP